MINLELTIEEANQILNTLAQQPYVKVKSLIEKIQSQAQGQINEEEPKK